jgi:hypothetical protein
MTKRKDDQRTQSHFRTNRVFKEGDKWFFHTREGTIEGPFHNELEARTQIDNYIKLKISGLLSDLDELSLEPLELEQAG